MSVAVAAVAAEAAPIISAVSLGVFSFMVLPMAVGLIMSCYNASTKDYELRKHINELNSLNERYTKILKEIRTNITSLTDQMIIDYDEIHRSYSELSNTMDIAVSAFSKRIRTIEVIMLILTVIIFFILLLKQFDLLNPFMDILAYPFVAISNLVVKK